MRQQSQRKTVQFRSEDSYYAEQYLREELPAARHATSSSQAPAAETSTQARKTDWTECAPDVSLVQDVNAGPARDAGRRQPRQASSQDGRSHGEVGEASASEPTDLQMKSEAEAKIKSFSSVEADTAAVSDTEKGASTTPVKVRRTRMTKKARTTVTACRYLSGNFSPSSSSSAQVNAQSEDIKTPLQRRHQSEPSSPSSAATASPVTSPELPKRRKMRTKKPATTGSAKLKEVSKGLSCLLEDGSEEEHGSAGAAQNPKSSARQVSTARMMTKSCTEKTVRLLQKSPDTENYSFFEEDSEGSNTEKQGVKSPVHDIREVETTTVESTVESTVETETQKTTIVNSTTVSRSKERKTVEFDSTTIKKLEADVLSKVQKDTSAMKDEDMEIRMNGMSSVSTNEVRFEENDSTCIPPKKSATASLSSSHFLKSIVMTSTPSTKSNKGLFGRARSALSFKKNSVVAKRDFDADFGRDSQDIIDADFSTALEVRDSQDIIDADFSTPELTFLESADSSPSATPGSSRPMIARSASNTWGRSNTTLRTLADKSGKLLRSVFVGGTSSSRDKCEQKNYESMLKGACLASEPISVGKTRLGVSVYRVVQIGSNRIVVSKGDITTFSGHAIVNAANESAVAGGGVAAAITRAAGPAMTNELKALPEVRPMVRIPVGQARITQAGKLKVEHVIHAVGPQYTKARPINGRFNWEAYDVKLKDAYQASITLAVAHGCWVVAFACLSTGAFMGERGIDTVLNIGLTSLNDCLQKHPGPPVEVHMVTDSARVLAPLIQVATVIWPS